MAELSFLIQRKKEETSASTEATLILQNRMNLQGTIRISNFGTGCTGWPFHSSSLKALAMFATSLVANNYLKHPLITNDSQQYHLNQELLFEHI